MDETVATQGAMDRTASTQAPTSGDLGSAPTIATALSTAKVPPPVIPDVTIAEEIGRGGMGVVYRGRQGYIDREVAIKLLLVEAAGASSDYVKRFQREAKILAGLAHPHIVACYQAGMTAEGNCYLVMEYIAGSNLQRWIGEHGPLAEDQALAVVRDIAQALAYAQGQGIIHRDVKPENVLLQTVGQAETRATGAVALPWRAKLVDLGLARPQRDAGGGATQLTRQGTVMGTPATMAPEQFDDPDGVDFRADIYGLGCVLFHALTGRPAFSGTSFAQMVSAKVSGAVPDPSRITSGVRAGTVALVAAMLAPNRDDRPASYQAIIARCETLIAGPAAAPRRPLAPVAGIAAGLLALGGIAWWALSADRAAAPGPAATPPVATLPAAPAAPVAAPATPAPPVAPAPAPAPAVAAPPVVAAAPWTPGAPEPLINADFKRRLEGWSTVVGWGPEESGNGIIGTGTSHITRPLRPAPWTIEGALWSPVTGIGAFREAGLRIDLADGSSVEVLVLGLGVAHHLTARLGRDGVSGQMRALQQLPASPEWTFTCSVQGGILAATVGGKSISPLTLAAAPTSLSLFTSKGPVGFKDLVVRH